MTPPSTSCLDWVERLKDGRSIIPPPLFPDQAEAALSVLRQLKIVDAPGSPTIDESCAQWVLDFVASVFGAYDPETGRRLIKEWFVLIPKKNSKSTIAAAVMLTAQILNWRNSAEFTIIAPTVTVAKNAFTPARDMVRHDDELVDLMHIQEHVKTIRHRGNEAELRVLAAESNTVGGSKSVGLLVDELHLFGQMSGAGSMFTEAQGGLAARPEGFIIWLTTQSDQPPTGVFREKLQYARDVRDGKIVDPEFVPIIYEFPDEMIDDDSFRDPDNFYIVNPNLGYSVDEAYLRREYKKAEVEGQESLQRFCAKHLNVEVGVNLRSDRWKGADHWEQCFVEPFSLDDLIKRCEVIEIGIDGGGLDDMLGFCVAGRITGTDDEWMTWEHAWIHTSVLELRKKEASRFEDFQQEGSLTIIETAGEDVSQVADIVKKCYDSGLLDKIGVDPHGLGGIIEAIEARDVPEDFILGVSQGWKMNGAIMTTERKLQAKKINHSGLKLMNWCVGNAKVKQVGNAKSITKQQSGSAKIDPLIALFNAISLLSLNPESKSGIDDFIMNPIKMR